MSYFGQLTITYMRTIHNDSFTSVIAPPAENT